MFQIQPIIVTGYHGTSEESALRILDGDFRVSENSWEWLGHGVYFWQDAPHRAKQWAKSWLAHKGHPGPTAVVAAKIDLRNFVDLLDLKAMSLIRQLADRYVRQLDNDGKKLRNKPPLNRLDCGLFNFATNVLSSQRIEVAGYRAACVEGERIMPESPIFDKSHVQISVIDKAAILEKWIVKTV